jgi:TRAP-type mannitol/chloroaromatic compound transport system permease small subunit
LGIAGPAAFVVMSKSRSLRQDDAAMTAIAAYIVRAAFWAVLLIGLVDAAISFLRVEDLLKPMFGDQIALDLGRNQFRGPYIHGPLLVISIILPAFVRTYGFTWLALLVVVAELNIVISRFIFSYEQAFMSDLVRMWYGALFLFASAYTLIEEGHVRVDVLYSGFTAKTKGLVNAIGALVLGLPICWTILLVGLRKPSSIIAAPLLTLEVTQSGFGMYIKYLMAGFLANYAISMAIQFSGYFLEGVADYRRDPGKRQLETAIPQ